MAVLGSGVLLVLVVLAAQHWSCRAAPTQDVNSVNRNLLIGLFISREYADLAVNDDMVPAENELVDTFCNLLSYHEMMKFVADNSSDNGTLLSLQALIKQNLEDTCQWISQQISMGAVSTSNPALFDDDSCSMNDTTVLRNACLQHRISPLISAAFDTARNFTGTVNGLTPELTCQWIERLGSSKDSVIQTLDLPVTNSCQ